MQYALVWLELYLIGIVFLAFGTSVCFRFSRRSIQLGGAIMAGAIPGAVFVLLTCLAYWLHGMNVRPSWLFLYFASLTLICLISAVAVIILAYRKTDGEVNAKRWPRLKIFVALLLLFAISVFTFREFERNFTRTLEKRRVRLEAMLANYLPAPPPASQNAAPMLEKAAHLLDDADHSFLETAIELDFDATSTKAQDTISQHQISLDLLHKELNKPFFHYPAPVDRLLEMGDYILLRFMFFRNAADLLAMEARSHSQAGRIDKAVESLGAIQRLAMFNYCYPGSLLHASVSRGMERRAFKSLENVLYDIQEGNISLSQLKMLDTEPQAEDVQRALIVEELFCVRYSLEQEMIMRSIIMSEVVCSENPLVSMCETPLEIVDSWLRTVIFNPLEVEWLKRVMSEMRNMAMEDDEEILKQMAVLEASEGIGYDDEYYIGAKSPHFNMFDRLFDIKAYRRLEALALALSSYYHETGGYPLALEALTPNYISTIPADPFDKEGGPLKMKPYGKGVLIYSNGGDRTDDGGHVKQTISENFDVVMFLGEKPIREKSLLEMLDEDEPEDVR